MTEPLYHGFPLGDRTLDGNVFLGPMAGYTDKVFRQMCVKGGAVMTFTEMVSAQGLIRDSANTFALLDKSPDEHNLAVQLFGSEPAVLAKAVSMLPAERFCAIDINCGCPVPKVVKTGAGSALLRSPSLIHRIVMAIKNETDLPVTVKIRTGWDSESVNYLETAGAAVMGGASAVCLHCRTRAQFYSGKPDYSALASLKESLSVPVIGSGDVFTPEAALSIIRKTHCDGLLVARGAIGKPYVFSQMRQMLLTGSYQEPTLGERIESFLAHLGLLADYKGETTACKEMRKHIPYLLKGVRNSAKVRQLASKASSIDDYRLALNQILDQFRL